MYHYIYDIFLNDEKYNKVLQKIEQRLSTLGIFAKKTQMTLLKSLKEIVIEEYNLGMRNFVAVGNDESFFNLINAVGDYDVTVGYIPVFFANGMAKEFGIPQDEFACDVLSSRITKEIDLGKINHYHFLTGVKIFAKNCILLCDESYKIELGNSEASIEIINLNTHSMLPDMINKINSEDGKLNLVIKSPARPERSILNLFRKSRCSTSFFTVDTIKISSAEEVKVVVDGFRTVKLPLLFCVKKKKIKIIVGKDRKILL